MTLRLLILLLILPSVVRAASLAQVRQWLVDGGTITSISDSSVDDSFMLIVNHEHPEGFIAVRDGSRFGLVPTEQELPDALTAQRALDAALRAHIPDSDSSISSNRLVQADAQVTNERINSLCDLLLVVGSRTAAWTNQVTRLRLADAELADVYRDRVLSNSTNRGESR